MQTGLSPAQQLFLKSTSVLDDRDATGIRIANANLSDGFINVNQITSQTYRAPVAEGGTAATGNVAVSTAVNLDTGTVIPTPC